MYNVVYKTYLQLPVGGLREVIKSLRDTGYRAGKWKTLWHATPRKNLPTILKHGLDPGRTLHKTGTVSGVYVGPKSLAAQHALLGISSSKGLGRRKTKSLSDWAVLRLRVPQGKVRQTGYLALSMRDVSLPVSGSSRARPAIVADPYRAEGVVQGRIPLAQIFVPPQERMRETFQKVIQTQRSVTARQALYDRAMARDIKSGRFPTMPTRERQQTIQDLQKSAREAVKRVNARTRQLLRDLD